MEDKKRVISFNNPDPLLSATARAVISAIAASFYRLGDDVVFGTGSGGGAAWMAEHRDVEDPLRRFRVQERLPRWRHGRNGCSNCKSSIER